MSGAGLERRSDDSNMPFLHFHFLAKNLVPKEEVWASEIAATFDKDLT